MKVTVVLVLICALIAETAALAKVTGHEVMYVGGTVPNLPEGTVGALDTKNERALLFESDKGKFEIPYENITSLEYGQKAGRRLGVAITLTIWALLSKKR